ncbi:MAG: double-strand break repair helicase AddA [Pseudomonadota bacterium]
MNEASQAQNRAARPTVSTWLTANAGSGKTRVLTDRVARLLLNGAQPENILCLTYTTAAASEMQNRLFKTLGSWAMLPNDELRDALRTLGEVPPSDLGRARTLFASAIEAPGGLKIQTIHSFCAKVLRQFPLEAGVNPQFRELDETAQTRLIETVIANIAQHQPSVIGGIQRIHTDDDLVPLAKDLAKQAENFATRQNWEEVSASFGVPLGETLEDIARDAANADDIAFLKSLVSVLRNQGTPKTDGKLADAFASLPDEPGPSSLAILERCFLTKAWPFLISSRAITAGVRNSEEFAPMLGRFADISHRVERSRQRRVVLQSAKDAATLADFAEAFLPRYEAEKMTAGALDFDDLVQRTKILLNESSLAWVHYRLDARIDHVLVDEAQDTSPAQWDIISALCSEMVSGESDRHRTLFVVGDKKQSIYSFQGADAAGFDNREATFRDMLKDGSALTEGALKHSFRSSPAILDVVDRVFGEDDGTGETQHRAFREGMPGRVDLWPLVERPEKDDELAWYDTSDRAVANTAPFQLASELAHYIKRLTETGSITDKSGKIRRIKAGDIMVLVQRRSALFDMIISQCKALEVPIAGADRLKLGSELVVRDILALLSFLALPDDDLSLAAALRSPLFGWSETDLYRLAACRPDKTFLWQELRRRQPEFQGTFATLTELRRRVDLARPYELIHSILTEFGGRRNFLARLGPEAEDGMDELLTQALEFERKTVPTLTEFVSSARASDQDVKREAETNTALLRVMTVHGAKGLESPIVILPDTTAIPNWSRQSIIPGPYGIPILTRGKRHGTVDTEDAKNADRAAEAKEKDRLLYVAMTRAENWLIVAGARPGNESTSQLNWHAKVNQGLESLETQTVETPFGEGIRYQSGVWSQTTPDAGERADLPEQEDAVLMPPAPPVRKAPRLVSPSDLGGAKAISGAENAVSGGARHGRQLHLLLEHLPAALDPVDTAARLLSQGPDAADANEIEGLLTTAQRMIADHADVFGADALAEVDVCGFSHVLNTRISGTIDRLLVEEDRILAVDFKTNAIVPEVPSDTPDGILRQMGAYLEVLEQIYPQKPVELAILWTTTGTLMPLEHGIVRGALKATQHLDGGTGLS